MDLFLINTQLFNSQDMNWWYLESCGLFVDYLMLLSAVWTLILTAPIHCRGIFIFGWTIPLEIKKKCSKIIIWVQMFVNNCTIKHLCAQNTGNDALLSMLLLWTLVCKSQVSPFHTMKVNMDQGLSSSKNHPKSIIQYIIQLIFQVIL